MDKMWRICGLLRAGSLVAPTGGGSGGWVGWAQTDYTTDQVDRRTSDGHIPGHEKSEHD